LTKYHLNSFDQQVKDYCKSCISYSSNRQAKVIIIGDAGVGKTSLINRFVNNTFGREYKATIGVDFEVEKFKILNCLFNLQLWDTAGHERFKCIASAYYRGANAIIVTFDLLEKSSLISCESWLNDALAVCTDEEKRPIVFLVGTKLDLIKEVRRNSKYKLNINSKY
jgi:Ras-related protein Rab-34